MRREHRKKLTASDLKAAGTSPDFVSRKYEAQAVQTHGKYLRSLFPRRQYAWKGGGGDT